jgi:hypothetical protein
MLLSRGLSDVRERGSDLATVGRRRISAGSGRISSLFATPRRGLATVGRGLTSASRRSSRALARGGRRLGAVVSSRRPSPRVAGAAVLLLFSGVGGYAVILSVGDLGDGRPSADDTARSASDHPGGARIPGLTRPGIFVSVAVDQAGGLQVSEHARTGKSIEELSITPPPALEGVAGLPRLEDVEVTADGRPVEDVPDTVEVTTVVVLVQPATVIELSYRVVGASARSKPATPGRATLSLRPALATTLTDSRTMIEVRGARVRTLTCVDLPPQQQRCGLAREGGWRTQRLDTASSSVLALVDLPDRVA